MIAIFLGCGGPSTTEGSVPPPPETGHHTGTSVLGHSAPSHSGRSHSATAPVVLPACDLPYRMAPGPIPAPRRIGLDELRSGWVEAPSDMAYFGWRMLVLDHGTTRSLAAESIFGPVVVDLPLPPGTRPWPYHNLAGDPWDRKLGKGDFLDAPGQELVEVMYDYVSPWDDICVFTFPLPPGERVPVPAVRLREEAMGSVYSVDGGNWDGVGHDELLVAWRDGDNRRGETPRPAPPYPPGGAAIYAEPFAPVIEALGADPPVAWYDVTAFDDPPRGTLHAGGFSRFVPDLDGDGREDVLVDGRYWGDIALRDPPGGLPHEGGWALFGGGTPGAHDVDDARVVLAAVCNSDMHDLYDPPTEAWEVGDLDGDGVEDLVFVAPHTRTNFGWHDVVWVATELPRLTGLHTYTEASSAVIYFFPEAGQSIMSAVGLGDVDGDGFGDLAFSVFNGLSVHVFRGPFGPVGEATDFGSAALVITPPPRWSNAFGEGLLAEDIDGDGLKELFIGDPGGGFTNGGAISQVDGRALRDALRAAAR